MRFAAMCCVAVLLTCAALQRVVSQTPGKPADLESAAKAFIELLRKTDYAKATETFDETMRKVLPAEKLQKLWEGVNAQNGALKEQKSARREQKGKYDLVYVTCV